MSNISKVKQKINTLTAKGEPYVFIIDFDGNGEVYSPQQAADEGIYFSFGFPDELQRPAETLSGDRSAELASRDRRAELASGDSSTTEGDSVFGATAKTLGNGDLRPKSFSVNRIPFDIYKQAFDRVQHHLRNGDTYLINLTFATEIVTDYSLREIFVRSAAPYKLLYKDRFVVFSPERFIRISDGIIETNPMKGTIDADEPDAERKLLGNEKEFFEHNTIVDLLRNDLNMVATDVKVDRFRYVDRIRTHKGDLLQVSSLISGRLPENYRETAGDIIFRLLPAGSVTGAPKERTVQIIRETENYSRGNYTGVFGRFDGKTIDVAVAIRFIERSGDRLYYKSEGGITSLSNAEDEYNELISKIYVPIL